MGIETLTFGPIYKYLLGGNAINAILFAGGFFIIAAILAMRLNVTAEESQA
jgi:maltose/moltooligosaccharide transporter